MEGRKGANTCVSAKRTGLENAEFALDVSGEQGVGNLASIFSIRFVWSEIALFPTSCRVDISSYAQLRRAYAETSGEQDCGGDGCGAEDWEGHCFEVGGRGGGDCGLWADAGECGGDSIGGHEGGREGGGVCGGRGQQRAGGGDVREDFEGIWAGGCAGQ